MSGVKHLSVTRLSEPNGDVVYIVTTGRNASEKSGIGHDLAVALVEAAPEGIELSDVGRAADELASFLSDLQDNAGHTGWRRALRRYLVAPLTIAYFEARRRR